MDKAAPTAADAVAGIPWTLIDVRLEQARAT
jgi:hypothetical protein